MKTIFFNPLLEWVSPKVTVRVIESQHIFLQDSCEQLVTHTTSEAAHPPVERKGREGERRSTPVHCIGEKRRLKDELLQI